MRSSLAACRALAAAALLDDSRETAADFCSNEFGMVPVRAGMALHDQGTKLIIVDTSSRLAAGTVASFTLHNWGAAAPITMQIWRPVGNKQSCGFNLQNRGHPQGGYADHACRYV